MNLYRSFGACFVALACASVAHAANDVWDGNVGAGLWLLHAWVWCYNPAGVFNPTNPLVHLH